MSEELRKLIDKMNKDEKGYRARWIEKLYNDFVSYKHRWLEKCEHHWQLKAEVTRAEIDGYLECLVDNDFITFEEYMQIFKNDLSLSNLRRE